MLEQDAAGDQEAASQTQRAAGRCSQPEAGEFGEQPADAGDDPAGAIYADEPEWFVG